MSARPWRPSPPPVSAETVLLTIHANPIVAIHFWAGWNEGYDRALDGAMAPLYREFGDRIAFRSLDFDDAPLQDFVKTAEVLNLPAIGFWRDGKRDRVVIGLRSATAWRETIREVLAGGSDAAGPP